MAAKKPEPVQAEMDLEAAIASVKAENGKIEAMEATLVDEDEPEPLEPVVVTGGPPTDIMAAFRAPTVSVPRTAVAEEYGDVFDEIDDIDVKGSRYKRMLLAQGQSKAVAIDQTAHAGEWVVEGFDGKKVVTIMPFSYYTQRQFWRKPVFVDDDVDPNELRDEMACVSQLRLMKRSEPELSGSVSRHKEETTGITFGGDCASCPCSIWQPTGKGNNRPPKCTIIHIICAVSLEHGCRVEIPFKKTSEKAGLELLTVLRTRGWGQVLFTLGGESDKNKAGQPFWKATFKTKDATPEDVAKGAQILRLERESMGY